MIWARFHASCRRHRNRAGADFADTQAFYRSREAADLLGAPPPADALPSRLIDAMAGLDAAARERALALYADLDLDAQARAHAVPKRMLGYFGVLLVGLSLVCAVMAMFVFPSFREFFQTYEVPLGGAADLAHRLAPVVAVVVPLVCLVLGLMALALHRLLRLDHPARVGGLGRLLPGRLRRRYGTVFALVCAPVPNFANHAGDGVADALGDKGLTLEQELKPLLGLHTDALARESGRFAAVLMGVVASLIALSLYAFMAGAYLPILRFGSVL